MTTDTLSLFTEEEVPAMNPSDAVLDMARRYAARRARTTRIRKMLWRCQCWHEEQPDYTPGAGYPGNPSCADRVGQWERDNMPSGFLIPGEEHPLRGLDKPSLCSRCARRPLLYQMLKSALAAERNARRGLLSRVAKLEKVYASALATMPSNPLREAWAIAHPDGNLTFSIGPSPELAWRSMWLGTCNGCDWDECNAYRKRLEADGFHAVRVQIAVWESAQ